MILGCIALLAIFMFLNNGPLFVTPRTGKAFFLANGALSQPYSRQGLTNQTCVASRMLPSKHSYLDNTISSIRAAFAVGADIVEFDVQSTKDQQFVVFHDWNLECRTNGKGVTTNYTLAQLKKLDIGYGYTADGGKTYPFRGKGIGLMPSLNEVLQAFPDQPLRVDIKSDNFDEGVQLARVLSTLPQHFQDRLTVEGGDKPIDALHQRLPHMRVMSKAIIQNCVLQYEAIGWTGYVPATCRHIDLQLPDKVAPWLWGWPDRFLERMDASDTRVILVQGNGSQDFSNGFDTPDDLKQLPTGYTAGIWTNHVDQVAPVYHHK
ncbi:glycerophosphoryl diester phosphodiesterase [Dictyobacter alpinus]|uniref:Glycerophosphoryl diester phosphodiesterase n=1 Tax=Dictyobacter alpinus TaxID=2014873 RepID=A0A402BK36_9CHLR|nr:glycerophosphodiester phosphodiesterase family protein [Dictyobacter alpinus]GCE31719.1 glycerophosphoryl diester phosphodiesterase [Dictyobacter alpinus]